MRVFVAKFPTIGYRMKRWTLLLALYALPASAATRACVTTPGTYDFATGASWVGGVAPSTGDRATCATSGVIMKTSGMVSIGDSPVAGTKVITFTGGSTLALGHNSTLNAFGDIGTSVLQTAAGSKIHFDSSGAASPTATPYKLTTNTFTDDGTFPPVNTAGNNWQIDYNVAGTPFRWGVATAGSGVTGLHNAYWTGCGPSDNSARCLDYVDGGSGVISIGPGVVWDTTCGMKITGFTANDGINITGMTFKNTYTACNTISHDSHITITNTCQMTGMVFDRKPVLQVPGCTVGGIFYAGMTAGVQAPTVQATMAHSLLINNGGTGASPAVTAIGAFNWNLSSIWEDGTTTYSGGLVQPPAAFRAGTVTGCTSTTATDSTASFPSTMIDDGVTISSGYVWVMTTGVAAGEIHNIKTAAPTVVTNFEPFIATCSAGDHYVVYRAEANPHFIGASPNTSTMNFTHTIFWFTGGDFNGDCIHSFGKNGATYNASYITTLPTVARNNPCTAGTLANNASNIPLYNIDHFTYFTGSQSFSACEGSASCPTAGVIHTFINNIAYDDPAYVYPNVSSGQGTLGPYKLQTSQGLPSTYVNDLVAKNCNFGFGTQTCADFNFGYGSVPNSATVAPNGYSFVQTGVGNKGYNIASSVAMGPHDVDNIDPGFTDRYANPIKYAQANGIGVGQVDPFQVFYLLLNDMMAVNDPGGSPHGTSPDGFYNYVAVEMAPHNAAYHNSGSDGADVGAWPYAGAPTPVSIALTPNPFTIAVGGTQTLVCTTTLSDSSTRSCISPSLVSSNPSSATVSGLVVTGVAGGSGTITATAETLTSPTDAFTVTAPPATTVVTNATFTNAKIQ